MAVNVARIYEQTIRPGRYYCRICLRTGHETALVTPRKLLEFTNALKLKIFDDKKKFQACYMCEATAGTAMRLYEACVNAVSVKTVCQPLENMKADDPVPEWLRKAILGCNANLKDYRQRTRLLQTEVLVVDSVGIEWKSQMTENENSIPHRLPINSPSEIVVLDDDEDETSEQKITTITIPTKLPKLVPIDQLLDPTVNNQSIATLLPNQMQIICKHELSKDNFIIHPVVNDNEVLKVPSLGCIVKDGQLVFAENIFQNLPMIDCTNTDKTGMAYLIPRANIPSTFSVHTTTEARIEADNKKQRDSKKVRVYGTEDRFHTVRNDKNKESAVLKRNIQNRDDNSCKKKCNNSNRFVVDLDTINSMISSKEDNDPIAIITNVKSENVDNNDPIAIIASVTSESVANNDPIAIIGNVRSESVANGVVIMNDGDSDDNSMGAITEMVSRAPKLVDSKIDWEDKIPMDVISFVDATDPNAQLIVPDRLPTLSFNTVTTQTQSNTASTQTTVTTHTTDPLVIDLC